MSAEATRRIHARTPPAVKGVPPRYQVFDRETKPPRSVSRFYFDPDEEGVVFEVYDDEFREFLKEERTFGGKRFDWEIDVAPDAPHDPRTAIIRPDPVPEPADRGDADSPPLTLEAARSAIEASDRYHVIQTSDPL